MHGGQKSWFFACVGCQLTRPNPCKLVFIEPRLSAVVIFDVFYRPPAAHFARTLVLSKPNCPRNWLYWQEALSARELRITAGALVHWCTPVKKNAWLVERGAPWDTAKQTTIPPFHHKVQEKCNCQPNESVEGFHLDVQSCGELNPERVNGMKNRAIGVTQLNELFSSLSAWRSKCNTYMPSAQWGRNFHHVV